jgi:hypothetical protein
MLLIKEISSENFSLFNDNGSIYASRNTKLTAMISYDEKGRLGKDESSEWNRRRALRKKHVTIIIRRIDKALKAAIFPYNPFLHLPQ